MTENDNTDQDAMLATVVLFKSQILALTSLLLKVLTNEEFRFPGDVESASECLRKETQEIQEVLLRRLEDMNVPKSARIQYLIDRDPT